MNTHLLSIAILAAIATTSTQATATPLAIANSGFEEPILLDGSYIGGLVPGWVPSSSTAGVFNPPASQFPGEAPEGQNTAYSQGAVLSQVLSDVLNANTVYTLQVAVGSPLTQSFPGYSVQLRAGGTVLAEDNSTLSPALGTFATSTVVFTALPSSLQLGQFIEITLSSRGAETDFDDVRLSATPLTAVPEPATLWLFGLGAIGFLGTATYRRAGYLLREDA